MQLRKIRRQVRGQRTVDGDGVNLVRVLGHDDVYDFDPFLMLDSFDSYDPADYVAGFPTHPHRGIETITYLIEGEIDHKDSLGNTGKILSGQSQWMTAGSGILHQEMPQPSPRMLGMQLWLNLPQKDKMTEPQYFDITGDMIGTKELPQATVRVISGEFEGVHGAQPHYLPARLLDVDLKAGNTIEIVTGAADTVFAFLIVGDAIIDGKQIPEKTAVLLDEGDTVQIAAPEGGGSRFILAQGPKLGEGIAWGGPIVMNTREELQHAFDELREGTFIKHN